MPLSGVELHHVALRMSPERVEQTLELYEGVLGLLPDAGVRRIEGIPGTWLDAANDVQTHLFGVEGISPYAMSPGQDPFTPHVAFGVPSITLARAELERATVKHWSLGHGDRQQVFLHDASGNMVELHQIGSCRCVRGARRDLSEPLPDDTVLT